MTNLLYSSINTGRCEIMTYKKWKHNQQVTEIVHAKLIKICSMCASKQILTIIEHPGIYDTI